MRYLIDGHNLIGQMRDISLDDPDDEEKLIQRLRAFAQGKRRSLTVVFDPGAVSPSFKRRNYGNMRILFAKPGSTADEVILQLVRRNAPRERLRVVTSDQELASQVRSAGADVVSAEQFLRPILPQSDIAVPEDPGDKPEYQPTKDEVEHWLAEFENFPSKEADQS